MGNRTQNMDNNREKRNKYGEFYNSYIFLVIAMLENRFKTKLVGELKERFEGCYIFHLDPNEMQGAPDLLMLYKNKWAALEGKQHGKSSHRPNQDYYIQKMNEMSFARFIDQENKEEVLDELERSFKA